jgi:hypothetical protein
MIINHKNNLKKIKNINKWIYNNKYKLIKYKFNKLINYNQLLLLVILLKLINNKILVIKVNMMMDKVVLNHLEVKNNQIVFLILPQ